MALVGLWLFIAPSLPDVEQLRAVELQVPLSIVSADDKLITTVGEQRRIPLTLDEIPLTLRQAFLAAEDGAFYQHFGIDFVGTLRGVIGYVRYFGQRRVPGGSTITQQVARRFFLSNEFSVLRKVREIFLAVKIERELEKDEILELYLNKEFLGHRAYGVGAAARIYYGKTVDELTLAEMAMIAGLPQRPSVVNPVTNPELALRRRAYVLGRMLAERFISEHEYRDAMDAPDRARVHGPRIELDAPWIAEIARRQAVERFGAERAYTRGYRIVTTIDSRLQQAARQAIRDGLDAYDRRHGWRGAERAHEDPTAVDAIDVESARDQLADARVIGDLHPAIVLESDTERARVLLNDTGPVEITLEQIDWARPFLTRDTRGARPERVDEVLRGGELVRLRHVDGAWRLAQVPAAEAALVSLRADDGAVLALVGGLDFAVNQFNRATQSQRQPGSAFKPFVYSAALANGYTPASRVNDAPIVFDDPSQERAWKPQNFSERFFGPTRLREAMIHSRNLISVRLVMDLGLDPVIDYVTRFGFRRADIPRGPSMALGSASITPLDLAVAYTAFANGGFKVEPRFIHAIIDDQGRELPLDPWLLVCADCAPIERRESSTPTPEMPTGLRELALDTDPAAGIEPPAATGDDSDMLVGPPIPHYAPRIVDAGNTWLIRSMMRDVVRQGTGRRALALGRGDLAGKTGTTNDQRDTWFAGFNDRLVTTVWVGMDSFEPLGQWEQGGRTALPIWVDFMRVALDGMPETADPMPNGIVEARIDPETGERVRPGTPGSVREWFPAESLPPMRDAERAPDDEREIDPYSIF
ncbi:MAG: PBP1A family penicillin-binding protein [Wenzhouxiangellaceae bacterium]|nr:PBP1A family penicillin-binding protein [Wenzhouxiangellaceae bacterium]